MLDKNGNDKDKAYITTFTGKKFYLLEPRAEDIDIVDIAHALSLQCRWTGHTKFHYSVAQHSYYCSFIGPESEAFDRHMHDTPETYIGDLNRPLKHYTEAGVAYRKQEAIIQEAIANRYGYSVVEPPSVKLADNFMLYAEMAQLIDTTVEHAEDWERYNSTEHQIVIEPWSPVHAELMFLKRFKELYTRRIN
jgi:uncharacterized protein